jgi:hypothetical protein
VAGLSNGRTIWIADAHRGDGKRFIVRANEKLATLKGSSVLMANSYLKPKLRGRSENFVSAGAP